jgi:hypothetical protein
MKRWLGDFRHAYKQHPISAVLLLATVILALLSLAVASAYRASVNSPIHPAQPNTPVTQPAKGRASVHLRGPVPAPPTWMHAMPPGAGYDDSSNSWYARHRSAYASVSSSAPGSASPGPGTVRATVPRPTPTPIALNTSPSPVPDPSPTLSPSGTPSTPAPTATPSEFTS